MQNKVEYLQKLHNEILFIMDEINRICHENNLTYYLMGGSLLGAVRHGGFIPWDDDLDIAMPRDDFEKFVTLFSSKVKDDFYLEWYTTNKSYWLRFAKVCRKNTVFNEGLTNKVAPFGIFVDIFPLDLCDGYSKEVSRKKNIIVMISAIAGSKFVKDDFKIIHWPRRILKHFFSTKTIHNICEKIAKSLRHKNSSFYVNFGSQYSSKKETMPTHWYGEGIYLPFENRKYRCPIEYKKVLTSVFGSKYMQLPPENKRRSHYPIHVKFSDGMQMDFKPVTNKIIIKEKG